MPDKDKHFADNAGILKKIKSVLGLNIGTMLFGALFPTLNHIWSLPDLFPEMKPIRDLRYGQRKYIRQRQGDMSVIMPGKVARLMPTAWYMVSAVHRRQNRLLN